MNQVKPKATVIIPTTGTFELKQSIQSVLDQTIATQCYVVCDGKDNFLKTRDIYDSAIATANKKNIGKSNATICYLPINVGANGFYGHRVYAAFTHLVDTEYVLYLDQDNWMEPNHVESCIKTIEDNNLDWCYSLRKIVNKDDIFECNDDCESLGKYQSYHGINHVDTNCYAIRTDVAIKVAGAFHGGWGQDRVFLHTIAQHFNKFDCTGEYTLNYRLAGNEGSVTKEFFINGNNIMSNNLKGKFPWVKNKT